jgi:hypothetical protein
VHAFLAPAGQDEDWTVLPVRPTFGERREAGQDELLAGKRAAQDVAARLTALRDDALHRLPEVVETGVTDALEVALGDRRDGHGESGCDRHVRENTGCSDRVRARIHPSC